MTKTIEFDTGLNLDELRHDLREAEKEVERLSKKLKKQMADRDYYYAKQREAEAIFGEDSKEAKSYLTKWINASDAVEKTTVELEKAESVQRTLTENVDEATVETTKWQEAMAGVANIADEIKRRVKGLIKRVLFFSVITKMLRAVRTYLANAIQQNEEANVALQQLKLSLDALVSPLLNALIPALVTIFNWLSRIITALATLVGRLFPKATKGVKKLASTAGGGNMLAGFDTIMTLGGGGGSANEAQNNLELMQLTNEEIARILMGVGLIASLMLAWKVPVTLAGFFADWVVWITLIASVILQIYNFLKMWEDGIDLSNLAGVLVGILGTTLLLRKMFGPTAQGISLLTSGILLLVSAIKDTDKNGVNLANTLALMGGIIATGLGIATLTKNLQWLTVAGILALLYAITALGGQGVQLIDNLKLAFGGLLDFIMGVFTGDWEKAWNGIKNFFKGLWNSILAIFGGAVNAIVRGINWVVGKINQIKINIPNFLGGGQIGFNLPYVGEWQVPYLAEGAVIPPNREFMAVLGDQKSGTNIETPLETMIQAFRQAQSEQTINITFNGDLASLAAILAPQITQYNKRRGL